MSVQALPRRWSLEVSPERFRQLALSAVGWLILIVATGATVRLTGSGLGCPHWPGCHANDFARFEPRSFHSYVEFSNRIVASLTVLATLVLAVGASRTRTLSRGVKILAWVVFAGTLGQAPLGAITVYYDLNPWLVLTHLLVSLVVLGLGVVVLLEATRVVRGSSSGLPPLPRAGGIVLLAAAGVLVVTGTLATAAGPHPGSTVVRRLWSFEPAVYWHVRATAVFGISFALVLAYLVRAKAQQVRGALVLLGVLAVQMTIGEAQYRTHLPWWLVLVHVTVAATVWAAVTSFVFSLWRPRRMP